jgi:hypothetical protein
VEWSLDSPLPKLCPVIPTSNQDGRQAKYRKKWDEILIVHCCFSISQKSLVQIGPVASDELIKM